MKKRIILGLFLAAFVVGSAFAAPDFRFSLGGGAYFTSDFGGGIEASAAGQTIEIKMPYAGGGGFVFLDATYAELSLGIWGGGGKAEMKMGSQSESTDASFMGLDIGLLGKYPFAISEGFSFFPMLGITYRAMLNAESDGVKFNDAGDLSALWFKAGVGLDYYFTDNVFLRGGILYGIRLANKLENDGSNMFGSGADIKPLLGHGLEAKLAIGYSF